MFQAKDAIMELQPICEFWDFLYHLVDVSIVFVGVVPGTLEHHLRLVLALLALARLAPVRCGVSTTAAWTASV